uniref:Uncharacterized protein n=1 Tax=Macrostomum lignano TaxID=282301 RepID=A0A1I8HLP0_9PLAT
MACTYSSPSWQLAAQSKIT